MSSTYEGTASNTLQQILTIRNRTLKEMQSHGQIKQSSNKYNRRNPSNTQNENENENENKSNTINVSNIEENEEIARKDDSNQESHTTSVSTSKINDEFTIYNDDDNQSNDDNWREIQDTSNIRCLNCHRHQHRLLKVISIHFLVLSGMK